MAVIRMYCVPRAEPQGIQLAEGYKLNGECINAGLD